MHSIPSIFETILQLKSFYIHKTLYPEIPNILKIQINLIPNVLQIQINF